MSGCTERNIIRFTALLVLSAAATAFGETARFLDEVPAGFTSETPVSFYDRGSLYEYIDGQAVFYNSYGFTRLEHGTYRKSGGVYTIDIYELGSRLSAFGAFRQQREAEAQSLNAGVEGAIIDYLAVFYKDRYYVEIIPLTGGDDDMEAMKLLVTWVDGILPGEKALPPEVAIFPPQGLVPRSERYVDESLISYSFMGRGLTATYTNAEQEKDIRIFIAFAPDIDKAREVFASFVGRMSRTEAIPVGNAEGIKGDLPYRGKTIACRIGPYVYGEMGAADENKAAALLISLGERLKKHSESARK